MARPEYPQFYVLTSDGDPWPVDLLTWGQWFETHRAERIVQQDDVSPAIRVSTVFLGVDHGWGDGPPLIFETMIFRDGSGEECWRYTTRAEALAGHARALQVARGEIEET